MEDKYLLESESDEDESSDLEIEKIKSSVGTEGWQLQDIDQLKLQTNSLLDSVWKDQRNKNLIVKLLDLEQPVITAKMVDFLMHEGVCEALVAFITQNGASGERSMSSDQQTVEMKLAYRAVVLLSPEMITEPLNALLSKKATIISRLMFNLFVDDSLGSFYHAYRLYECLLRCYPSETFDGISNDGYLAKRLTQVIRYIGYPPVCELLVMIVAFTPVSRSSQLFAMSEKSRWSFLQELSNWNLLLNLTLAIVNPSSHCRCDGDVNEDQHSTAACQLFQDLVEKVSLEDTGDLLLVPLGQDFTIIDLLVDAMINTSVDIGVRRSSAKIITFLLRRAAESEIVCFVTTSPTTAPTATYLPNRLFALRERIVSAVKARISDISSALQLFDESNQKSEAIQYSSYEVKRPFGTLRLLMIEVVVLTIESDETVASLVPLEIIKSLISWTLKYPHNNIYHALFYRMIFAILRQGQEVPQRLLFQKAKFATFLVDNFLSDDNEADSEPTQESIKKKIAVKGLIMNSANAIRLQTSTEPSNSFLLNFLNNHAKWNDFINNLTVATDAQLKFGMGIKVVVIDPKSSSQMSMQMLVAEGKPISDENSDVRFAKSLGFFEDAPWSLTGNSAENIQVGESTEDKYLEDPERLSYLGEED